MLVARRVLTPDALQYTIFKYHHLYGAGWDLCVRKLALQGFHMDRGEFFHEVYRIESKLGRVFRELEPMPCIRSTSSSAQRA